MAVDDAEEERELTHLQAQYLAGLPGRVESLGRALERLDGPEAAAARAEIRKIAHELHGSGETYGHPEISAAAGAVEAAEPAGLTGAVGRLLEIVREVAASPPGEASGDLGTGLASETGLFRAYAALPERGPEKPGAGSLALLRLDGLEEIVRGSGKAGADEIVKRASDVIAKALDRPDVLARRGALELLALSVSRPPEETARRLRDAQAELRRRRYRTASGQAFQVGFTAGIATLAPGEPLADALARAEGALRQAATGGPGTVECAREAETADKGKVLFVEDDDIIAGLVKHRLAREGLEVLHYTDGAEAWAAAQGVRAQLVILDVKLPGMDGFDLLRRLRQTEAWRQVPILMLTALSGEADVVRGFETGADDYLTKPFSPLELQVRVQRLLRKG